MGGRQIPIIQETKEYVSHHVAQVKTSVDVASDEPYVSTCTYTDTRYASCRCRVAMRQGRPHH